MRTVAPFSRHASLLLHHGAHAAVGAILGIVCCVCLFFPSFCPVLPPCLSLSLCLSKPSLPNPCLSVPHSPSLWCQTSFVEEWSPRVLSLRLDYIVARSYSLNLWPDSVGWFGFVCFRLLTSWQQFNKWFNFPLCLWCVSLWCCV